MVARDGGSVKEGTVKKYILIGSSLVVAALVFAAAVSPTNNEVPLQIIKVKLTSKGDASFGSRSWGNSITDTTAPYTIDVAGGDTAWAYSLAIDADSCNGAVKTQFGRNGVWMPVSSTDSVKRRSPGGVAQATTAGDSLVVGQYMQFRLAATAPGASQVRFIIATTTGNSTDDNDAGALVPYPYTMSIIRPDPNRR